MMSRSAERQLVRAIRLSAIVLVIALWDVALRWGWIDPLFLASPLDTLIHIRAVVVEAKLDIAATVTAFLVAFVTGVIFALGIGFAISLSNYSRLVFLPVLVLGVTIPKVTLMPLFILWFGIARLPVIVFGALSAFFPMVVNVLIAGNEVKPAQVLLARAMGLSRVQIYRKVVFPAMLPVLSSGLFYACNAAMMGVFIVELALDRHGMGAYVHDLAMTFRTADMYAAVVLTAGMTVLINMALWYIARYFGRWRN
ncbi:MAG TPA: ABC transporter permease subunit [Stellaceae bacterium]|jgi:ABC-type nitrate/sulfonate/bicarbonate transport system permease component|nr:ABC transporter permease subunit [Stellaceae bacterium]